MLEVVTMKEIDAIFAVTDALGVHREMLVIPLGPGTAIACGFVPRRRAAPPHGATLSPPRALAHSMPISPSAAAISA